MRTTTIGTTDQRVCWMMDAGRPEDPGWAREALGGEMPERFGTYRLESLIGRGGMGEVYRAWDERLERHVALKRILPDPPPDARSLARFQREARAVARLNHPAIVQIFDVLETESGDCLVMEYVEGRSLPECIAAGDLDLGTILRWGQEIAEGLAEAHGKGLIHRDLKPENVRITRSGGVKILDFGLARLLWQDGELDRDAPAALTESGALVGTVHAMSPEQASGRAVDHRSDLFAFGSLLYEMLTGKSPFRGANTLDTLRRVLSEEPAPLDTRIPGLPGELIHLVETLLHKDPNRRPQNAQLVAQALGRIASAVDSDAALVQDPGAPESTPWPRAQRAVVDGDLQDMPTGELMAPVARAVTLETGVRTLLATGLVDFEGNAEDLGAPRAAEIRTRHDRMARDLLARHGGHEIDSAQGFLVLFDRPLSAVAYALAYHQRLVELSNTLGVELLGRAAIHLGEVILRHNPAEDVSRGARPVEVEGHARTLVRQLQGLASARQTLLTQSVFDLARRVASEETRWGEELRWLAHGAYLVDGVEDSVELFEVGIQRFAPLEPPTDSSTARRAVSLSEELVLGWRPAPGQAIPRRPHWVLDERLGAGGFGEVWLAAHKSGEKRVFKFCFEASRLRGLKREVTLFRILKEALGHRDDIARILDWNFEIAPYFLEVEYTEGGDLLAWAESRGGLADVPLSTRLDLVAQVADALAAAHSVGVLHKDVKPENVLVAPDPSGRPRVRLTDFGVGLVVDRSQFEAHGVTALGWTATVTEAESTAGSHRYLAPELLEGKAATVHADVFSLGVLLYQAVVGDFSRALASGWQRDIDDELLRQDIDGLVDGVPERRPRDLAEVARRLRRLEERHRERAEEARQRNAAEADRRALELARRRRRWTLVAAMLGFVALLGVLVVAERERRARVEVETAQRQTLERQRQAEGLIRFMLGDLREKLEPIGRLDVLADVGQQALAYFETVPRDTLSADELSSYARALHQIGDVAHKQGDLDAALGAFEQAFDMSESLARRDPDRADWQQTLGEAHYWVGFVAWRRGDLDAALERFEAYFEVARDLAGRHPDDPNSQLELIYAHSNIGSVLEKSGDLDGAIERYLTALAVGEVMVARDPDHADFQLELAITHNALGAALNKARRLHGAIEHFRKEVAIKSALVDADPESQPLRLRLATAHHHLGNALDMAGEASRARQQLESADRLLHGLVTLDPTNLRVRGILARNQSRLGVFALRQGDAVAARGAFLKAIDTLTASVNADPSDRAWQLELSGFHIGLGWACRNLRAFDAARKAEARAGDILGRILQESSETEHSPLFYNRRGRWLALVGQLEADRGDWDAASLSWEQALVDFERAADPTNRLAEVWILVLGRLGRIDEAQRLTEEWAAAGYVIHNLTE